MLKYLPPTAEKQVKCKTNLFIRKRETQKMNRKNKKALTDLKIAEKEKNNVVESMKKVNVHKVKAQTMELKSKQSADT